MDCDYLVAAVLPCSGVLWEKEEACDTYSKSLRDFKVSVVFNILMLSPENLTSIGLIHYEARLWRLLLSGHLSFAESCEKLSYDVLTLVW